MEGEAAPVVTLPAGRVHKVEWAQAAEEDGSTFLIPETRPNMVGLRGKGDTRQTGKETHWTDN